MYIGAGFALIGAALFYESSSLLGYAGIRIQQRILLLSFTKNLLSDERLDRTMKSIVVKLNRGLSVYKEYSPCPSPSAT